MHNKGREKIKLFIANGPGAEDLAFLDAMPENFDSTTPDPAASLSPDTDRVPVLIDTTEGRTFANSARRSSARFFSVADGRTSVIT